MKKFIEQMLNAANKFKAVDYALFKIYMISIGLLLGAYFAQFWISHIAIVWGVALVAGIFVVWRLLSNLR